MYYDIIEIGKTGNEIDGFNYYFEATGNNEPIDLKDLEFWAIDQMPYLGKTARANYIMPTWELKAILCITSQGKG